MAKFRVVKNRGGFIVMLVANPITSSMFMYKGRKLFFPMHAEWFKTRYAATKKARYYRQANKVEF